MKLRTRTRSAWRFRGLVALAFTVLSISLHAEDGSSHTPSESSPCADSAVLATTVTSRLREAGFAEWNDREAHEQFVRWVRHRSESAWRSLRNVSFTAVYYGLGAGGESTTLAQRITINDVEAKFDPAEATPVMLALIARHPFFRGEPFPRRIGGDSGSIDGVYSWFLGMDGRRVLFGQYPRRFYRRVVRRQASGDVRVEFHLVDGSYDLSGGEQHGYRGMMGATDVLLTERLKESDSPELRFDASGQEGLNYANPWSSVFRSPRSSGRWSGWLETWLDGEDSRHPVLWWRSEERVAVALVKPLDGGEGSSVSLLLYDRATGLPLEHSVAKCVPSGWRGSMNLITYDRITTSEGEELPLPSLVLHASGSMSSFLASLVGAENSGSPGYLGERGSSFQYHHVNDARLDDPDNYGFQRLAERLGVRLAPISAPRAAEVAFPDDSVIYGPPENDPDRHARWDAANREAILASGLPVDPDAHLIPYDELARRVVPRVGRVYRAYYVDETGSIVELPIFGEVPAHQMTD